MSYILENEDITNVGGPMGSSTSTRYRKYFKDLANAKSHAVREYVVKTGNPAFKWKRGNGQWSSPDLGYVMYTISKIEWEDA